MRWRLFWGIFAVAQVIGALGVATGSPHGFALGLVIAAIFLFPGSILSLLLLDAAGVGVDVSRIVLVSMLINIVCWGTVALAIAKIRGKKRGET